MWREFGQQIACQLGVRNHVCMRVCVCVKATVASMVQGT